MLDVEVIRAPGEPLAPSASEIKRLCQATLSRRGITEGHLAVEFVGERRMAALNARHRHRFGPTDVLSFPVDGAGSHSGPSELGDVVICLEHTIDLREAVVHGVLHLAGMDHETDGGEMLALQRAILAGHGDRPG